MTRSTRGVRRAVVDTLPIDAHLGEILGRLEGEGAVVIEAEPGAGKTTQVPKALLDAPFLAGQEIWVLEPRRLAARLSATFIAGLLGETLGERVGYQVRFESVEGPKTRLRFLTEGLLTRKLISNPTLQGVGCVVFDEFHERHLHSDLGLAVLARLRQEQRPDMRLVVMSATLDGQRIAKHLAASHMKIPGRVFPVQRHFFERPDKSPLEKKVLAAIQNALPLDDGNILVFLPGAGEIQKCLGHAQRLVKDGVELLPLYGSLPAREQDRAVRPQKEGDPRRVIFSTNIAETSLTLPNITTVIDAGLVRQSHCDPWRGGRTLRLQPIAKASAIQRAGRAGRTQAGQCFHLYTRQDFNLRPDYDPPEIVREDLAQSMLLLARLGYSAEDLPWFEEPPKNAVLGSQKLLRALGAFETDTEPESMASPSLSAQGEAMARLPLHPRHGRILAGFEKVPKRLCGLVAILSEREVGQAEDPAQEAGASDIFWAEERLAARNRRGLHPAACRAVDQTKRALERLTRAQNIPMDDAQAIAAILSGFGDRVAKRQSHGYTFVEGATVAWRQARWCGMRLG